MHLKNAKTVGFRFSYHFTIQNLADNLTDSKLSKNNYLNKHHTFKEYVTIIDVLAHPGPNVPYVHIMYSFVQFGPIPFYQPNNLHAKLMLV